MAEFLPLKWCSKQLTGDVLEQKWMKSEPHIVTVTVPKFCPQPSSFSLSHDLHTLCKWWLQSMCFHFTIYGDFRNSSSHAWYFPSDITIARFTLQRQNRQTSQLQVASIWNQLVSQSQPPSTEQLPSKSLALDDPPALGARCPKPARQWRRSVAGVWASTGTRQLSSRSCAAAVPRCTANCGPPLF